MAASDVAVCNLALAKIGTRFINSLAEESREARYCNVFYAEVRNAVLRDYPWNFAEKQVALVEDPATTPLYKFSKAYHLPTDCLRALHLDDDTAEFAVSGDRLHTDHASPKLVYTAAITDPDKFDPSFTLALAARLAAELAEPITKTTTKSQSFWTLYINILKQTRLSDAAEGQADPATDDDWLATAGFGGGTVTVTGA